MPITETSGIAGTVGGGGGGGNTMERFAEMMFRMREAKQQEAAQKLETSFKIFDATGIMPSESDLKGPLKQLGVTLTPEMMQQFAERGQQQQTSRQEAARLQKAQTQQAEAVAAQTQMETQRMQRVADFAKRAQTMKPEERLAGLKTLADAGDIKPSDLMPDDVFEMSLQKIPENQMAPDGKTPLRQSMRENRARNLAGMWSTDQLASDAQKRVDDLQKHRDQMQVEMDNLSLHQQSVRTEQERTAIERQRMNFENQARQMDTAIRMQQARASTFKAIDDYIKTRSTEALNDAKDIQILKKAGQKIPKELEDRVMLHVAESKIKQEITYDAKGNPMGLKDLEAVRQQQVPAGGWRGWFGETEMQYIYESLDPKKIQEQIDAEKPAKTSEVDQSREPVARRAGTAIREEVSQGFPTGRAFPRAVGEKVEAGITSGLSQPEKFIGGLLGASPDRPSMFGESKMPASDANLAGIAPNQDRLTQAATIDGHRIPAGSRVFYFSDGNIYQTPSGETIRVPKK